MCCNNSLLCHVTNCCSYLYSYVTSCLLCAYNFRQTSLQCFEAVDLALGRHVAFRRSHSSNRKGFLQGPQGKSTQYVEWVTVQMLRGGGGDKSYLLGDGHPICVQWHIVQVNVQNCGLGQTPSEKHTQSVCYMTSSFYLHSLLGWFSFWQIIQITRVHGRPTRRQQFFAL